MKALIHLNKKYRWIRLWKNGVKKYRETVPLKLLLLTIQIQNKQTISVVSFDFIILYYCYFKKRYISKFSIFTYFLQKLNGKVITSTFESF